MALFKRDPLQIVAFQSYGTQKLLYVRGRALEDENIDLSNDSFLALLRSTWKRFETDEVKHTRIKLRLPDDTVFYTETDKDGYFKIKEEIDLSGLANDEGWVICELAFDTAHPGWVINNDNRFPAEVLVPSPNSSFGVISDIDDTILHTGVTSFFKLKLLFNTFFRSAKTRSPLKGAADFYQLLHRGSSGEEANPMFYVSHSPWNLYRYLELFLKANNFPKGPILLRNLPNPFRKKKIEEKPQKQLEILDLLETYPNMTFILIGDSGEHDADIYIEIAERYPGRIKAIYLRSVKHEKKMMRIRGLFESYKTTPVLLVDNSEDAIVHAREHGFIQ